MEELMHLRYVRYFLLIVQCLLKGPSYFFHYTIWGNMLVKSNMSLYKSILETTHSHGFSDNSDSFLTICLRKFV